MKKKRQPTVRQVRENSNALLNEDLLERKSIAENFHRTKGGLIAVKQMLELHKKKIGAKTFKLSDLDETMHYLKSLLDDFDRLNYEIFYLPVKYYGLFKSTMNFADHIERNKEAGLQIINEEVSKMRFELGQEARIYKVVTQIIELMCQHSTGQILVYFEYLNKKLRISFLTSENLRGLKQADAEKIKLIKAQLYQLRAVEDRDSNWKSVISYSFKVTPVAA